MEYTRTCRGVKRYNPLAVKECPLTTPLAVRSWQPAYIQRLPNSKKNGRPPSKTTPDAAPRPDWPIRVVRWSSLQGPFRDVTRRLSRRDV